MQTVFVEATMSENEAIYNIGVVARMTDIPAATLRIWERRYDFPETERTAGGHRLYTEKEIQRLHWVKARLDAGMQVRQAIRALRVAEADEGITAVAPVSTLPVGRTAEDPEHAPIINVHMSALRKKLLDALLAHETGQADQIFTEAFTLYTPEDLIVDLIGPTLRDIGLGWEKGEIDIGTEHLATNYLRQHLLAWMRTGPPPYTIAPIVLACAPGEWHEGSLLMFGALLRRRRWPIAYLGQSIPLAEVAKFVQDTHPPAVVLTAVTEDPAMALIEWPKWLPEADRTGEPLVGYGGPIFNERPELRAKLRGLFLGTTLQEGVETLERILQNKVPRL